MKKLYIVFMCLFIAPMLVIASIRENKNPIKSIKTLIENLNYIHDI